MRAQHVQKSFSTYTVGLLTLLFLILSAFTVSVDAGQSFTATLSLYEGIDLTSGMTEMDQTVLTLLFGDNTHADIVVASNDHPFNFSPSVDVYFGFESGATDGLLFMPEESIVGLAVLSSLPTGDPASLLVSPFSTSVSFGDMLLFHTSDGQLFIINDLAATSATTLSMRVEAYSGPDSTVPEPSTLLLLDLGIASIAGIAWRTGCKRQGR